MKMLEKYLRKTLSDVLSFLVLLCAIIAIYLFELLVVAPEVHPSYWQIYCHAVGGTYILLNILGNLFKVMTTDTTTRGVILPSLLKEFWQFCSSCEANAPPRSFHCHKCRSCVLKRDHHCVFVCGCIGLKNFRYYLMFLLHLALGALYAMLLNMFFIWGALGGFSFFSVAVHFVPFGFWTFGYVSGLNACYALLSMLSITGFFFVLNLLILHCRQMLKNQTSFEKIQGNFSYDLGWRANLKESLGSRWHLVWLFPTILSALPGDGLTYTLKQEYSDRFSKAK